MPPPARPQQQKQQRQEVDAHPYHALLLCALGACMFLFGEFYGGLSPGSQPPPPSSPFAPIIAYELWNTNESKGHVYPYLASFITFSCLLMTLILLIICGPELG